MRDFYNVMLCNKNSKKRQSFTSDNANNKDVKSLKIARLSKSMKIFMSSAILMASLSSLYGANVKSKIDTKDNKTNGASALSDKNINKNGILLGVSLGAAFDIMKNALTDGGYALEPLNAIAIGGEVALKVGYQYYFTDMIGLRGYANYAFRKTYCSRTILYKQKELYSTEKYNNTGNRFDVNVDGLFDLVQFGSMNLGVIAGLFVGYNSISAIYSYSNVPLDYTQQDPAIYLSGISFGFNIGTQLSIANHHHVELLGKIPFTSMVRADKHMFFNNVNYYGVSLGYTYTF